MGENHGPSTDHEVRRRLGGGRLRRKDDAQPLLWQHPSDIRMGLAAARESPQNFRATSRVLCTKRRVCLRSGGAGSSSANPAAGSAIIPSQSLWRCDAILPPSPVIASPLAASPCLDCSADPLPLWSGCGSPASLQGNGRACSTVRRGARGSNRRYGAPAEALRGWHG